MIKFSVVIPVYNKGAFIAKTLESVLNQTHKHFELLILNDGSTDNSQQILNSFKDSRIKLFNSKNIGAGAARNFLIGKAENEYIAFLDADDLWMESHLSEMGRLIEKHPNKRVFATNTIKTLGPTNIHRNFSVDIKDQTEIITDFFKSSYLDCILTTPSLLLHKKVIKTCGNFNPTIKSGQDIDLFIRIGLKFPIVFSTLITVTIIGNLDSLSNTTNYKEKMSFEQLMPNELINKNVKKYYDLNRYALAIMAKEQGFKDSFEKLMNLIDPSNLHWKQKLLLKMPAWILSILLKVKKIIYALGFSFTVFK